MIVAEGILTWHGRERRSDRYGSVEMMNTDGKFMTLDCVHHEGLRGRLFAEVVETRQSGHIGDIFRGLYPETPEVGEVIELGIGRLFVERVDGISQIGLVPDDGRDYDWLDPKALYRLHEQTVRLQFEQVDDNVI